MFFARYQDGQTATDMAVECDPEGSPETGALIIRQPGARQPIARWKQADLFTMASRRGTLRIGCFNHMPGARIIVEGADAVVRARAQLPGLVHRRRTDRFRQMRLIALSMVALIAVVAAYIFGIPLIANRVVAVISPQWEAQIGETVAEQVAGIFGKENELVLCDPDPGSLANRAIERFRQKALDGVETPFDIRIAVIKTEVPNAIALPGGRVYFFEALLREAKTADEFAGVLAHEFGHVVERHGMERLVASAGTGLLVGLVLGDVTGLSLAGAMGSMLVESHFSREHELAADRFARETAARLRFDAEAMVDLLDRIDTDDEYARAMAFLSTHPLTDDRRRALTARTLTPPRFDGAFSEKEWYAIARMCD